MWLSQWRESWNDSSRIRQLNKSIAQVWRAEFVAVKSRDDDEQAHCIARSITMLDENEREWLIQKPVFRSAKKIGLVVPPQYYCQRMDWSLKQTLTDEGVWWAKKQINNYRMGRAKDWMVIVMPILSLVASTTIAVLGLLVALKKR